MAIYSKLGVGGTSLALRHSNQSIAHQSSGSLARRAAVSLAQLSVEVAWREARQAVPRLRAQMNLFTNRVSCSTLSRDVALKQWQALAIRPDEVWVDLGTGNGQTLRQIAAGQPGRVIGVDLENSVPLSAELNLGSKHLQNLPSNADYFLFGWNDPDRMKDRFDPTLLKYKKMLRVPKTGWTWVAEQVQKTILYHLGEGKIDVVSLIFPYTEDAPGSKAERVLAGKRPHIFQTQLETAVRLLRPGGMGCLVLESGSSADEKQVLRRAVTFLRSQASIASLSFCPEALYVADMGIAPYVSRKCSGELATSSGGNLVRFHQFQAANVVFFRKRVEGQRALPMKR